MFGDRLKLARKKAGFSLRALAQAPNVDVSAQAIGKYERGEMMPSSNTLLAIQRALDVSLDYLLSEQVQQLDAVEFRKHSGTSAKERARVEAAVIEKVERYLAIEEILELPSHEWAEPFSPVPLQDETEAAEDLAARLRMAWKLGEDPIPNMTELLEEQGLKVLLLEMPKRVSGLTCIVRRAEHQPSLPAIVVNSSMTLERRRLTLAHELGHRLIDEGSSIDHEKACNRFAGAFLMPREHLNSKIGGRRRAFGYDEIIALKRLYRVSAAALLVRLRDIDVIDNATLTYSFQTIARTWRSQEPHPLESSSAEQREWPRRFERLCYRALAEEYISPAKAMELLEKPLVAVEKAMKGPVSPHASHH